MKKNVTFFVILFFLLGLFTFYNQQDQFYLAVLKQKEPPETIVLDAGHGGSDPGKIGCNQILEKNINLAITLKCKALLEKQNVRVILTRNTDEGLYEDTDTNKKASDMKKRRFLMEQEDVALAVSIHQNSYPSEQVFGAQVFYYTSSEQGKLLANNIQTSLQAVNPENKRQIKASNDYYILKAANCPVVICECGFLSNPEECAKLNSEEYQEKVAKAIATGILSYLFQNEKAAPKNVE